MTAAFFLSIAMNTHILYSDRAGVLFAWGNTHKTSRGSFWPASTIKLLPALAVMRAGIANSPRIKALLHSALSRSSNSAFDRLVRSVGADYVNDTARLIGLAHTWISRPYSRGRRFRGRRNKACPSNCTSLADLQVMIRLASRFSNLRKSLRPSLIPSLKGALCKPGYIQKGHIIENCIIEDRVLTIATRAHRAGYKASIAKLRKVYRLFSEMLYSSKEK